MIFQPDIAFARQLDRNDPLRDFRQQFRIPEKNGRDLVYFLGNSLGLQPMTTRSAIDRVLQEWADYGVEGFFMGESPWLHAHDRLAAPLARLTGALPSEISVMNQLTVNLHLMLASFYQPNPTRYKILCEARAFPSDQYMLETHVRKMGYSPDDAIIEVEPRPGEACLRAEDLLDHITRHQHELALVLIGGVNYYTGQVLPMASLCREARKYGIPLGFDLAHAVGNIPLQLHDWGADFACWCSYKYLNSGPGAIGGVFVHERHHHNSGLPRLAGWWGYDKNSRFRMEKGFVPYPSAEGWQLSTPSILLYAMHEAALMQFEAAGPERLHQKRRLMGAYMRYLLQQEEGIHNHEHIKLLTPAAEEEQGCQLSFFMEKQGRAFFDALTEQCFMIDWREPGVIRLAPVPMYNRFEEIWQFVKALGRLARNEP